MTHWPLKLRLRHYSIKKQHIVFITSKKSGVIGKKNYIFKKKLGWKKKTCFKKKKVGKDWKEKKIMFIKKKLGWKKKVGEKKKHCGQKKLGRIEKKKKKLCK